MLVAATLLVSAVVARDDDEAQDDDIAAIEMLPARGSNLIELVDFRWFIMLLLLGGVGRPVHAGRPLMEDRFTLLSFLKELPSSTFVVYLRE